MIAYRTTTTIDSVNFGLITEMHVLHEGQGTYKYSGVIKFWYGLDDFLNDELPVEENEFTDAPFMADLIIQDQVVAVDTNFMQTLFDHIQAQNPDAQFANAEIGLWTIFDQV